jgi:hypothetical protein
MSDFVIELPRELEKEAREAGILRSDYIASMLRREIRRRRVNNLFSVADRLAEQDEPLTDEEIQAEIDAYRKERHP